MSISDWLNPDKEKVDYTILVVSDDPITSRQLQDILEEDGYTVLVTASSQDALELLNGADLPHVFIGDFVKPDVDAKEFLDTARIRFGKAALSPVLLLMDSPDDEMIANELGLHDVLPKPFEAEQLIQCVERLIDSKRKTQESQRLK
jgi:two-component system nitrogen regulation response regulator NtrX